MYFLAIHPYFDKLSKEYEGPIRIWLGPLLIVLITDAEDVEILLKSKDCLNKPYTFYKMIRDGLGVDGLFTSKGLYLILDDSENQRKLWNEHQSENG